MATFYPSCVLNLKLRFDESLHVQTVAPPVSTDTTLARPATGAGTPQLEPLIIRRGDDNASFVMNRIPKTGQFELPGYRQAGQFQFTLDFKDLPIDPRTVHSAAVEVHLGAVAAESFARGMAGAVEGSRDSVIHTRDATGAVNQETLVMVGLVDEWQVNHTDSGSEVEIRGRDMRGVLLDTPLTNDPSIQQQILEELDLSQPIDLLIKQLLSYNPLFSDFSIFTNPAEWPNGVLPVVGDDSVVPRARRGARGNRRGGRATPNASGGRLNFWDLVVRFCYLVGAIPYFRGTDLYLRPSRSIFDQLRAGGPLNPTPFAGGVRRDRDAETGAPIDPALRFRRLVYGRDTMALSFDRKMAGMQRPKTVRAISVDTSSTERGQQRVIQGRWPPEEATAARRQRQAPGGQRSQEQIINVPVPGIRDQERLVQIARAIYEEIGRGELGGRCMTRNLASFGGNNADPDLLRLKPGDGIEFLADIRNLTQQTPLISTLTDHLRNSFEEQVAAIQERIGDANLARVIVATSRGQIQEIQRFFRVSTVKFSWSSTGVQIDFDFQNYVVPTFNVDRDTDTVTEGAAQSVTVPEAAS